MDDRQFDTLVRSLAAGTSRRTGIRLLAGAGAALVALARGSDSGVLARRGTAGPGDPCRHDDQCLGADAPLVCAWNGFDYDGELNCCTYEGNRCGFDEACCGLASCVGGFCSGGGFSSAGTGGFASANAQGGTISIGDINSGGNVGNTISVGNTQGSVRVSGGSVSNTTDISASADGGMAIAGDGGTSMWVEMALSSLPMLVQAIPAGPASNAWRLIPRSPAITTTPPMTIAAVPMKGTDAAGTAAAAAG